MQHADTHPDYQQRVLEMVLEQHHKELQQRSSLRYENTEQDRLPASGNTVEVAS
jgi:hypothetical protein